MKDIQNLASFNNSWYKPGNRGKRFCWFCINVLFFINPINPLSGLKVFLLRLFGARIGKGVHIKPGVNIKYPWFLSVGDFTWIGEKVWIDNLAQVRIGNNVCISQGAMLLTGNHNYSKTAFDLIIGEISLQDGVWIGARCVVCPGITCYSHAVLSVGSIATKNLEPDSIYQGNPAQKIKDRVIS